MYMNFGDITLDSTLDASYPGYLMSIPTPPFPPLASQEQMEARLRALEEQAHFTNDILDMATSLGDFQTSINKLHSPDKLFEETRERIASLTSFTGMCFWLVDEQTSDFTIARCMPEDYRNMVERETQRAIENGFFAVALRENRPISIYSQDGETRLIFHVLATSSRTRGMFVGFTPRSQSNVPSIVLSLITIILKSCANAIESYELYSLLRQGNCLPKEGGLHD